MKLQNVLGQWAISVEHRVENGPRVWGLHFGGGSVLSSRATLEQSSALAEVDQSLVPIWALEDMSQTLAESRVYISHWVDKQPRADDEQKRALRHLVDDTFPAPPDLEVTEAPGRQRGYIDTLRAEVDALVLLYENRTAAAGFSRRPPCLHGQATDDGAELESTERVKCDSRD